MKEQTMNDTTQATAGSTNRALKIAMIRAGLTRKDLASKVGVHVNTIGNMIARRYKCGEDVARNVAKALGVTREEIDV